MFKRCLKQIASSKHPAFEHKSRRLARRAGVQRMSAAIMDEMREAPFNERIFSR